MYEKLYKTVDERLQTIGAVLPIRESVACAIYGKNPLLVDAEEFALLSDEDFLEYVFYRCLDGIPDEDTYKLFYSPEQLGQFHNKDALRLFIILSITESGLFKESHKKLTGLDAYWNRLRKERKISLVESMKLQSIVGKKSIATRLYENVLHPIRKMLPH